MHTATKYIASTPLSAEHLSNILFQYIHASFVIQLQNTALETLPTRHESISLRDQQGRIVIDPFSFPLEDPHHLLGHFIFVVLGSGAGGHI